MSAHAKVFLGVRTAVFGQQGASLLSRRLPPHCASLRNTTRPAFRLPGTDSSLFLHRPGPPFSTQRRSRHLPAPPLAALYHLPPDLQSSIQTGLGIAWMLALPFSALPILTGDARERNEQRFAAPNQDESMDNVRWSVMAVLSFIPFLNWLAWVFAAFDDEDSATLYYTYAFLYALPYLANGVELDGFAMLALLVGAAHVQIERIALTEPTEVELPEVAKGLLRAVPSALKAVGRFVAGLGSEAGERVQSADGAARRRPDRKYLEEKSREARVELEEFDRKARERDLQEQEQRRRQQQQDRERQR